MNTGKIRRLSLICLAVMLMSAESVSAEAVNVTADRLNIRAEASADSRAMFIVRQGDAVKYVCETDGWIMVDVNGRQGYVSKNYVSVDERTVEEDISSVKTVYDFALSACAAERVNMRELPITNAKVVKVIGKNDSVTLTGECGDWYCVSYAGKTGFVMKRYIEGNDSPVTVVASGTAAAPASQASSYASAVEAKTNTRVNLRASANVSSSILKVIPEGAAVTLNGESGSWCTVTYGGKTGFVSNKYIDKSTQTASVSPAVSSASSTDTIYTSPVIATASERLNLRQNAASSSKALTVIAKNASFIVTGENGSWYKSQYNGKTGYVSKSYVTLTGTAEIGGSTAPVSSNYINWTGVTTVDVNLRAQPEGDVQRVLKEDTEVTVIGQTDSWYQVRFSSSTGFIAASYIAEKNSSSATAAPAQNASSASTSVSAAGTTAWVTGGSVNVRKGAGASYGVVSTYRTGTKITVYEQTDGWYRMTCGSVSGWISAKYVTKTDPGVTPQNPSSAGSGTQIANKTVINSDWWTGEISKTFARGDLATVTDVDTGLSFQVKRTGGTNHADCQPLTKSDTAIMKKIYGGTWSWNRRAIWVTVDGKNFAASMNGMPHGETDSMPDNNFDGCFCIHFKNSRTHAGNRLDSAHQAAVKKAASTPMP